MLKLSAVAAAAMISASPLAMAQSKEPIKVGILHSLSGVGRNRGRLVHRLRGCVRGDEGEAPGTGTSIRCSRASKTVSQCPQRTSP
ncbi:hypothetical protein AWV80_28610 [Cupriavidus sp. UYMU48A]|nr:hypothetical protein AWV80_28610 [Cupriavidus sp. UYMU48A]